MFLFSDFQDWHVGELFDAKASATADSLWTHRYKISIQDLAYRISV
ncbi:MAG: hypothetical protein GY924_02090 [Planctomycetaceae bacterium]|nr:hypothetical protein [Planctomycetaceae bacterium]